MKICFPVIGNEGVRSKVYNHFGSAPHFIIYDTEKDEIQSVVNDDQHHAHGACNPIKALGGYVVDAIVVGGIGQGALIKLTQAGVKVFKASASTIEENLSLFKAKLLPEYTMEGCCGGHAGHACAH